MDVLKTKGKINVIYIIGGTSRAGKSSITNILARKYNLSQIPMDSIMSSLIDIGNPLSIDYKADSDIIATQMWPFTEVFIKNMIDKGENDFILEGISFWPDLCNKEDWNKKIKACFIGYTQIGTKDKIKQLRDNSDKPNSWQKEFSEEELEYQIDNIKKIGKRLKRSCEKNNFKYFESVSSLHILVESIEDCLFT